MKPEVVFTRSAPKTGFSEGTESPIAQGVKVGGFLFVSGQGPLDPATKAIVSQDIAEQTRVTLDNVKAVLEAGGTSIANVVRVGVYLRNMDDFAVFNRVFKEYFQGVQPARTTVEAAPPRKGVNVEIDAVAWVP
jgi:2-iminobutanoate/2-iminopropanoate deaminase